MSTAVQRNRRPHGTQIGWTLHQLRHSALTHLAHDPSHVVAGTYRPFCKQRLYFDRDLNEMVYQQPRIYPTG